MWESVVSVCLVLASEAVAATASILRFAGAVLGANLGVICRSCFVKERTGSSTGMIMHVFNLTCFEMLVLERLISHSSPNDATVTFECSYLHQ